jgi:hypothetical protein
MARMSGTVTASQGRRDDGEEEEGEVDWRGHLRGRTRKFLFGVPLRSGGAARGKGRRSADDKDERTRGLFWWWWDPSSD